MQQLRAYIDVQKREIRAAERRYDVQGAADKLKQLAHPLSEPQAFPADWKEVYVDTFYRDVAAFVLGFVAINLEPGFSDEQRRATVAQFFDIAHVPASEVIGVLATTLAATKLTKSMGTSGRGRRVDAETSDENAAADAHVTIAQCVRHLETAVHAGALDGIFCEMLAQEETAEHGRNLVAFQSLVSHMGSLPGKRALR
uniref:Telomere length regulation protein conserved domain-containing protein n=1 Tax=Globisporangium ultimum (strain ATCC 200006 / CBS 805.95 / DAOM BR144) TaxID=431595 RepID=K3X9L8_GLOUD